MIEIRGLTKRYGDLTAVDDLWLTVERGSAMGFIGPNGAGKTTTIRMLTTLLEPDEGTAWVCGSDIRDDPREVRARVGYMPDFFGVYDDMMVWEYLDFFAAAHRVPRSRRPGLIDDVLELTDLGHRRDDSVNSLSRGMKQRLCLAKTLVHDPDVLLLDEPASGLDPRARMEVRELLRELCKLEKTLLISSHILPELAGLCNEIAIIEEGKLVTSGPVDAIAAQLAGGTRLIIRVCERVADACELLVAMPEISGVEETDGRIEAMYEGEQGQEWRVLSALVNEGLQVRGFQEEEIDLETIYVRSTRGLGS